MDNLAYQTRAVRTYLTALVGSPVLEAVDEEVNAVQSAINAALLNYWIAFPYTFRDSFSTPTTGSLGFSVPEILARAFSDENVRENAYFLGISRLDDNPSNVWGRNIDSYLLGVPFYGYSAYGDLPYPYSSPVDLAQMTRISTEANVMTGEVEIEFNPTGSGSLSFLTPNSWTQLTVWFAFGFNERVGMRYIPMNMMDYFRKLAGVEFLNIVLMARTQVQLNADYRINVDQITRRRDELKSEANQMLGELHAPVIMWG